MSVTHITQEYSSKNLTKIGYGIIIGNIKSKTDGNPIMLLRSFQLYESFAEDESG